MLPKVPVLQELHISDNDLDICDDMKGPISDSIKTIYINRHHLVIGRMRNLRVLNGSVITPEQREQSERRVVVITFLIKFLEKDCGITYPRMRMFLTTTDGLVEECRFHNMSLHSLRIEDGDVLNLQVKLVVWSIGHRSYLSYFVSKYLTLFSVSSNLIFNNIDLYSKACVLYDKFFHYKLI
uniref:Ubiquitin-like domain-containing protein n=1 Tax=Heterorhabditis bacteriophora TaxID=37862 RepID=A0A1I7X7L5_HETBA